MFSKPQTKHRWLHQLVGNWRIEQQCTLPDGTTNQTKGIMTCRSIGGLWIVAESSGQSDEGEDWTCLLTLGYDPKQNAYIGTFIASMMTHLWQYKGQVDASGRRLPLDSSGPTFDGSGHAAYRDTVEIESDDCWRFSGELQHEDGSWLPIMSSMHYRQ